MEDKKDSTSQQRYVHVKDKDGNQYVCKLADLKNLDDLTDEEKESCLKPPGDAS